MMLLLIAVLATAGCTGVVALRTPPPPISTLPSPVDEWEQGCGIGYRSGWNDALSSRPFDATYPDTGDGEYLMFMDGYAWGYDAGQMEGTDWLENSSGNHVILWCSPENRP
jgi:hypothetical protein